MKMIISMRWLPVLVLLCWLSACMPAASNAAEPGAPKQASPTPANPNQATFPPQAMPMQPTHTQAADMPSQEMPMGSAQFQGPLSVILENIVDNAVVQTSQFTLSGTADPETVISFDDQIVLVGQDRSFSLALALEEGPNMIEITASDPAGNTNTAYLTITYDPQP
jgi:hypothetical protein